MVVLSNDAVTLVPKTTWDGPTLEVNFPSLAIGIAEYPEGPTGCTVFCFARPFPMAVDIRGGSPGFVGDYGAVEAICLAGGSLYGLEAAMGVQAAILARRSNLVQWGQIALVSGAIIYDFRPRENSIYPDKALGRAAFEAARPGRFPLGAQGAGRSATVGKGFPFWSSEPAGQGGAFRQVGEVKLGVFTVVNAVGAIVNRNGEVVRGNLDLETGQRHRYVAGLERVLGAAHAETPGGNTTVTVALTNQQLDPVMLRQVARQVHSSMSRGIDPFHAINDGDVLFAVSTGEVEDQRLGPTEIGSLLSELAWDAVLASFAE
jgi:L-aminopeptidase/D-esterase-like protein